jgi:microcystin-dependent protein
MSGLINSGRSGIVTSLDNVSLGSSVTGKSFAGMIAPFAMAAAPAGWLLCDGTRVLITTPVDALYLYAELVTAIYVGDGSNASASIGWGQKWDASTGGSRSTSGTYLSLPDLRGAFLRGIGTAVNTDYVGPTNVGEYQDDQNADHTHSTTTGTSAHTHTTDNPGNHTHTYQLANLGAGGSGPGNHNETGSRFTSTSSGSGSHTHTALSAGGHTHPVTNQGSTEARVYNLGVQYMIKY